MFVLERSDIDSLLSLLGLFLGHVREGRDYTKTKLTTKSNLNSKKCDERKAARNISETESQIFRMLHVNIHHDIIASDNHNK